MNTKDQWAAVAQKVDQLITRSFRQGCTEQMFGSPIEWLGIRDNGPDARSLSLRAHQELKLISTHLHLNDSRIARYCIWMHLEKTGRSPFHPQQIERI